MKKEKKGIKKEKIKEEFTEIFEVEKDGKEEIVKKTVIEDGKQEINHSSIKAEREEKAPSREQLTKEKKTLRDILIVMGVFVVLFLAVYSMIYFTKHFTYYGITSEVVQQGALTLHRIAIPVTYQGAQAEYNFYLRTNPRVLANVPFNGEILVKKDMVIDMTEDFNCDGDGIIAVANLLKLYNIIGVNVIRDENASCDFTGKYMFLKITSGNETKIDQFGPICYRMTINNCEILKGTEKFMLETFVKLNERLREAS
ncbi:hypothetical protein A3K64_01775 [Candidatus Micrarchaeota archaeon RBG_16_36_9]|nr:MAG: hypothetical protein A3K64_01775 [Candidatus Micrarchaeota archaeon RBG_16_36_9]